MPRNVTIGFSAATVFMLIGVASARADGCSNATLQGSYAVSVTGELLGTLAGTPPVLTPFPTPSKTDGVLIFSFDGAGHSDILGFVVRNGVQAALGLPGLTENGFQPQTGTYTVAPDCTGTGTIVQTNMSFSYAFVTGPHGRTFKYVTKSGHAALIPNNPNCVAPAGCDLALNQIAIGEQITR